MILQLEKPVIGPMLERELKQLAKDGITPTAAEVLWLSQLCADAVRPNKRTVSQVFGLPVRCGTDPYFVYLYRPCYGVRIWFDEVCRQFMPDMSPHFKLLVHGFMCANGRTLELFEKLLTKKEIERAVIRWAKTLPVNISELQEGIDLALDIQPETETREIEDGNPEREKGNPLDFGVLISLLSHYFDCSKSEVYALPDIIVESMIDALPTIRRALNPMAGETETEGAREFWNLRQAVRIIRADHAKKVEAVNG
jgi:hypothetical protein